MKTCHKHNYNPPSNCPNCRIAARRRRKTAAKTGWETRRNNHTNKQEVIQQWHEYAANGWLS